MSLNVPLKRSVSMTSAYDATLQALKQSVGHCFWKHPVGRRFVADENSAISLGLWKWMPVRVGVRNQLKLCFHQVPVLLLTLGNGGRMEYYERSSAFCDHILALCPIFARCSAILVSKPAPELTCRSPNFFGLKSYKNIDSTPLLTVRKIWKRWLGAVKSLTDPYMEEIPNPEKKTYYC